MRFDELQGVEAIEVFRLMRDATNAAGPQLFGRKKFMAAKMGACAKVQQVFLYVRDAHASLAASGTSDGGWGWSDLRKTFETCRKVHNGRTEVSPRVQSSQGASDGEQRPLSKTRLPNFIEGCAGTNVQALGAEDKNPLFER